MNAERKYVQLFETLKYDLSEAKERHKKCLEEIAKREREIILLAKAIDGLEKDHECTA